MSIVINTIGEYIQMKIDRNNLLLKVIDLQNSISYKKILVLNKTVQCNKIKSEILNRINEIESIQKLEFDVESHNITDKMYSDYNKEIPNIDNLKSEIKKMEDECIELIKSVDKFNSSMPNSINWANIYLKRNDSFIDNSVYFKEETEE